MDLFAPEVTAIFKDMMLEECANKKRKAEETLEEIRPGPSSRTASSMRLNLRKKNSHQSSSRARKFRIVDPRMATRDPERFLRDAFFDENGKDGGYSPVPLKDLDSRNRASLHHAASALNLFH